MTSDTPDTLIGQILCKLMFHDWMRDITGPNTFVETGYKCSRCGKKKITRSPWFMEEHRERKRRLENHDE